VLIYWRLRRAWSTNRRRRLGGSQCGCPTISPLFFEAPLPLISLAVESLVPCGVLRRKVLPCECDVPTGKRASMGASAGSRTDALAAGRHPQWEAMRKLALQQPLEQQGCGERQRSWAVEVMLIAMFLGLLVARWSSKQAATSPC